MFLYDEWLSSGERVALEPRSRRAAPLPTFHIFCRVSARTAAPWLTLLHGFPSSSWDYAKVLLGLEAEFRVVAFDFLGFGNSDKPRSSRYMIHQQADLTEAVWRHFSVRRTAIVAHDYGVSVAQELLARREQGAEAVEVSGITFLNGGLYADLHRPLAVQRLLRKPLVGPLISALANEWMFRRNFRKVFSHRHLPSPAEIGQHWRVITRRGGHRLAHRLIHYMADREQFCRRWEGAIESTRVPLQFVWGMADPVSGAHVADRIRARLPRARLVELTDVGHYPQLEAPERVLPEILRMMHL
ncbi:MAG: alpha/beta hydrolase [Acidobacteria bacterium]|nr:MAG: alpha/beta hydrolase [Acidobacteriota bacterium]